MTNKSTGSGPRKVLDDDETKFLIGILRRCVVTLLRFVLCGANNFLLCINIVNIRSFCVVLEVMF